MTDSVDKQRKPTKIESPEFLLSLVLFFMLWTIGLVDLFTHTSLDPESRFVGSYTRPIVMLITAYMGLVLLWLGVLIVPRSHLWINHLIQGIQARLWLIVPIFGVIATILWSLFRVKKWEEYPGLGLAVFGAIILLALILVLTGWGSYGRDQLWRKVIAIPLVIFLLIEGVTQGAAYGGLLPHVTINSGLYVPNGRVYQSEEGFTNASTNRYGWYYPDFRLNEDEEQIMVMGDTFVQGLQVAKEQNLGVHLYYRIQDATIADSIKTEVFALGMPGFGPGLYLSETRLADAVERFQPDEIVLLFHLANDFQVVSEPSGYELYYTVDETGKVDIHPDAWAYRHDLQHFILHGYEEGITPLKTLASHVLSPRLVYQWLTRKPSPPSDIVDSLDIPRFVSEVTSTRRVDQNHTDVTEIRIVGKPGASNFLFDTQQSELVTEPFEVAFGLLRQSNNFLKEKGIKLRIVTIPAFPRAFFEEVSTSEPSGDALSADWSAEIGPYDLFLPERKLAEFAHAEGIDLLPMGHYMQQSGLTNGEIQTLYFQNGLGHFTEAGHQFFGNAIFDCFYSKSSSDACGIE